MLIDANTCFGLCPRGGRDLSLATLLAVLRRQGVDQALTYSVRGVEYDFLSGNEETRRVCQEHPQLLPVATVHPGRHVHCRDEILRVADEGFAAVRFFPDAQGWPIVYQPFLDLCELLAEVGLPIILPAGPPGQQTAIGERLGPLGLNALLIGAGYNVNAETASVLARWPSLYTESHMYDTPGTLEYVGEVAGFDRLVFGSNSPDRSFEAAYHQGACAHFTAGQRADFFAGNLLRFLGRGGD
ncbi:MAG: amidohydrolase family protein [Armatimonadetes bacterium]|nr:amidohydrolase family protein [Armatimonadota bacterium]